MQMDYLDLYYCHRFDTTTPLEETLRTLSGFVDQGKILYYSVSEEWGGARLQSLAQMALAYAMMDDELTSVILGASRFSQIEENLGALERMEFSEEEKKEIEEVLG